MARNERGDTIVEVMIAIAIVSLVLVTAYVTTRHSLDTIQDTQEHSVALQLLQSQIEFLRSTHKAPPSGGCFYKDATYDHSSNDVDCKVDNTGSHSIDSASDLYTISVTTPYADRDAATGIITYQLTIKWASLLNGATNNVTLYYQEYATT